MTRNNEPSRAEPEAEAEFWGVTIDEILRDALRLRATQGGDGNGLDPGAAPPPARPARQVIPSRRIVPAPTDPMGVARGLLKHVYTTEAGLLLQTHVGDFFRWNGACWPEINRLDVRASAYRFLETAVYEIVVDKQTCLAPFEPTKAKIENVIDALKAITFIPSDIRPPAWTANETGAPAADEIVSMKNGLLHVPTRRLLPHTPDYFVHHSLPFRFVPDAPQPSRLLAFLHQLWPDDPSSIATLQDIVGYVLAGGTEQQKIFLLVGPKRSGKGTIGRVLRGLLGAHNVVNPTLSSLSDPFRLQPLIGKPLAIISDARLTKKADVGIILERLLSISGEDPLTIGRKYKDSWTGCLPTRFLILTNELPRLTDSSGALASRFILLTLTESSYGRENLKLTKELLSEAPSILNWALEGLDRLTKRGYFVMPDSACDAIQQLEDLSSPISAFLREMCEITPDADVEVDEIWSAWKSWCENDNRHPGSKEIFGRDLRAAAPTIRKVRPRQQEDRIHSYQGIRLRAPRSQWSQ